MIFKKGRLSRASRKAPHDGDGELHVAFVLLRRNWHWESGSEPEESKWEEKRHGNWRLEPIISRPGRHLVELATPGTWLSVLEKFVVNRALTTENIAGKNLNQENGAR